MTSPLRVLVVDDSLVFRKLVSEVLSSLPDVQVVATAPDGKSALARIAELKPDLVTLDVEMPELNGLEVLKELRKRTTDIGVLMVSSHTVRGGDLTIRALELGAFDFVTKPDSGALEDNRASLESSLRAILRAYSASYHVRGLLRGVVAPPPSPSPPPAMTAMQRAVPSAKLIVVGVSTGGPTALAAVIPALPANLAAPVIVVQHMPPVFTRSLASSLDAKSALRVKEADDGEVPVAGYVYLAPGGRHIRLVASPGVGSRLRVTDDPPELGCKPSADYLFRSVAHQGAAAVLAVVMTGMGTDGTLGARLLKRAGGRIIAQDEASCVVFGMPKSVIDAGVVDKVCPLDGIPAEICRAVRG